MTQIETIRRALADGPGTSGELAAETGLSVKHCSAYLRDLLERGDVKRSATRMKTEASPMGAYIYELVPKAGRAA